MSAQSEVKRAIRFAKKISESVRFWQYERAIVYARLTLYTFAPQYQNHFLHAVLFELKRLERRL